MTRTGADSLLRAMTAADVAGVVAIQEPGAVRGLADVFPQEEFPFPREAVTDRWLREIQTPGIDCYVATLAESMAGFAAVRDDEFLHFGTAVKHWGTGLAQSAHDEVLARMHGRGVRRAWLTVFTGNRRGRRFYERLGWQATGERTHSAFPPHPELLRYEFPLNSS